MILHEILKHEYNTQERLESLAIQLGYKNSKKGYLVLSRFVKAGSIKTWLRSGMYDFKYNSEELVRTVAKVLNVPIEEHLAVAYRRISQRRKLDDTYIEVSTEFQRRGESLLLLMSRQKQRFVRYDKECLLGKDDTSIFTAISKSIVAHYKEHQGILPTWGKIEYYIYRHSDGRRYMFDIEGKIYFHSCYFYATNVY